MHEAGLAGAVADVLRGEEIDGARVRLRVSGGHADAEEFDGSFRLHLAAVAPDLDVAAVEIVHLPIDRLCIGCGSTFASAVAEEPCPCCGGSGLPVPAPERVEIELVRPDDRVT